MGSSSDNFERLLKLVALKRHEKPPPRYFSELSDRIMDRLERENHIHFVPWWRRWAMNWGSSPVAACSIGVVACTLLLAGLSYFLWVEPPGVAEYSPAGDAPLPNSTPSLDPVSARNGPLNRSDLVFGISTNPVVNSDAAAFPFGRPSSFQVFPANYNYIPRNN